MADVGKKLQELRASRGLSQVAFAKKFRLSKQIISNYENNRREPGLDFLIDASKFYNVSLDYICGINEHKNYESYLVAQTSKGSSETNQLVDMYNIYTGLIAFCLKCKNSTSILLGLEKVFSKLISVKTIAQSDKKYKNYINLISYISVLNKYFADFAHSFLLDIKFDIDKEE